MAGKRGLIMGVANDHSIAWGVANRLADEGAALAFTFQGDAHKKRLGPLAERVGSKFILQCDVQKDEDLEATFNSLKAEWGHLDFVVHSIAHSFAELKGRYVDTDRQSFMHTLDVSCFSFTDVARRASQLMPDGGSLITMTYLGASRVMPNYNVMGIAKAALETSVKYLASDLGVSGIRVNAISAGPMRTLAGAGINNSRDIIRWNKLYAPLQRSVELKDLGGAAVYLLSELSAGVTGEVHFVDAGFNVVGVPAVTK
jgi:enoyl-[acyl-carrier protein] reductase I